MMSLESVRVKDEPEWEWDSDTGVSEAAAMAGLYKDHHIKQELVLGPEVVQAPDIPVAPQSFKETNDRYNVWAQEQLSSECVPTEPNPDWLSPPKQASTGCSLVQKQKTKAHWVPPQSLTSANCLPAQNKPSTDRIPTQKQLSTDLSPAHKQTKSVQVSAQKEKSTDRVPLQKEWSCKLFNHQNHYTCEYCQKQYITKDYIRRHMTTHKHRFMPLICNICKIHFKNHSDFTEHMSTHTEKQRLSSTMKLLKDKTANETVLKLFKCNVCGKGFRQKGNMAVHQRTHTGHKPYQCRVCDKVFSQQTTLNNHMLWHKGVKPHSCHLCSQKFTQVSNLRQHIIRYHSDDGNHNTH